MAQLRDFSQDQDHNRYYQWKEWAIVNMVAAFMQVPYNV